jgi:hypothetical protein
MHLLKDKVKEHRVRWLEPMQRMDDTRIPEESFYYKSRQRRYVCNLRKRSDAGKISYALKW